MKTTIRTVKKFKESRYCMFNAIMQIQTTSNNLQPLDEEKIFIGIPLKRIHFKDAQKEYIFHNRLDRITHASVCDLIAALEKELEKITFTIEPEND